MYVYVCNLERISSWPRWIRNCHQGSMCTILHDHLRLHYPFTIAYDWKAILDDESNDLWSMMVYGLPQIFKLRLQLAFQRRTSSDCHPHLPSKVFFNGYMRYTLSLGTKWSDTCSHLDAPAHGSCANRKEVNSKSPLCCRSFLSSPRNEDHNKTRSALPSSHMCSIRQISWK